jgi:hypothetical protein
MAKVGGRRRADGKWLKPAGWSPPDIAGLLARLHGFRPLEDQDEARIVSCSGPQTEGS